MATHLFVPGRLRPLAEVVTVAVLGFVTGTALVLVGVLAFAVVGVAVFERLLLLVGLSVVLQAVGFAVVAVAYLARRDVGIAFLRIRRPTLADVGWTVAGLAALFVGHLALNLLVARFGPPDPGTHQLIELGRRQPDVLLLLVPLSLFVVGPGEEVLFRGVVQTRLVEAYGTAAGVVAASALFAVAHLPSYGSGSVAVPIGALFVLSLVFGTVYEVTDNLLVPAAVHGVYNATLVAGLYVLTQNPPGLVGALAA